MASGFQLDLSMRLGNGLLQHCICTASTAGTPMADCGGFRILLILNIFSHFDRSHARGICVFRAKPFPSRKSGSAKAEEKAVGLVGPVGERPQRLA